MEVYTVNGELTSGIAHCRQSLLFMIALLFLIIVPKELYEIRWRLFLI